MEDKHQQTTDGQPITGKLPMETGTLLARWCSLDANARVVVVADDGQQPLARELAAALPRCEVLAFDRADGCLPALRGLAPGDLAVALLSFDTFVTGGGNRYFSPFAKPDGVKAKYAFVRLSISPHSLREGLSTPRALVQDIVTRLGRHPDGTRLRVTTAAGTDLTLAVHPFTTCSCEITENGGMAFLPPSETSAEVMPGSACGVVAVDVTVGQLYHYGRLLGPFGLVNGPVTLWVDAGRVVDITGGAMAGELKDQLFALHPACREVVELGHGLSALTATGLIGVDESMASTCHIGIGDGGTCGVHLDVVLGHPTIAPAG